MKKPVTCFPVKPRRQPKLALVIAAAAVLAAPCAGADSYYSPYRATNEGYVNVQRDPAYASNTTSDCVHGNTGIASNLDCTRDHMNVHTSDTSAYNTSTGYLNASRGERADSAYRDSAYNR